MSQTQYLTLPNIHLLKKLFNIMSKLEIYCFSNLVFKVTLMFKVTPVDGRPTGICNVRDMYSSSLHSSL